MDIDNCKHNFKNCKAVYLKVMLNRGVYKTTSIKKHTVHVSNVSICRGLETINLRTLTETKKTNKSKGMEPCVTAG